VITQLLFGSKDIAMIFLQSAYELCHGESLIMAHFCSSSEFPTFRIRLLIIFLDSFFPDVAVTDFVLEAEKVSEVNISHGDETIQST
jgi:hypothetical protein